jgi:hypothetical protein
MTELTINAPDVVSLTTIGDYALSIVEGATTDLTVEDGPDLSVSSSTVELTVVDGNTLSIQQGNPITLTVGDVTPATGGGGTFEQGTPYDDDNYLYVVLGEDNSWSAERIDRTTYAVGYTGTQSGIKPTTLTEVQNLTYS